MKKHIYPPCSFIRRLAAMFYDSLLLLSIWFIATVLVLPFTGGKAIPAHHFLYTFYLLSISYLYFSWNWLKGQQTLGMRAWKVFLDHRGDTPLNWVNVSQRYVYSLFSLCIFGLGFLWSFFNKDKLTWHDYLSDTRLVYKQKGH